VFEITKTAIGYASTSTTLVSFNGTDGSFPAGSLIADANGNLFGGGMAAEDRLDRGRIEPLEDVADCGVRRCAAPVQTEGGVQLAAIDVDERHDASIRIAASRFSRN
jgi:hypothetical protein